jgi:hypothetical protein
LPTGNPPVGIGLMDFTVIPSALSDHDAVSCVRKINNRKEPFETITCRNYSDYKPEDLRNDLQDDCFNTVYSEENPDKAWNSLKNILLDKFNQHAPMISKRVKGEKSLPG